MRIFDNHIDVLGSNNAPILIVSITQVDANLEEWADGSEIPESKKEGRPNHLSLPTDRN
jgi:hypothetical protein